MEAAGTLSSLCCLLIILCSFDEPDVCQSTSITKHRNKSVSCHRKRLPAIPEGIPIETRVLDLSKNKLRLVTPDNFSSFQQLEDLDLSDNLISGVEPGSFRSQLSLRSLSFRSNLLQLVPAGVLSGLTNLTRLDLSHNRLVVLLDHAFQDLRRLTSLEVGDNELVYISQRAFTGLMGLQSLPPLALHGLNLTTLSITNTNLSTFPGAALRNLPYLTHLNLSHCRIQHIHHGELGQLPHLLELRLQGSRLLSVEPLAFAGLKSLQLLCLGGNPLVCDCRLVWLLNGHKPPSLQILDIQPECSAPQHLAGKTLRELKEPLVSRYMTCTKPQIGPNTTQLLMADEVYPQHLSPPCVLDVYGCC
uniref:Leucine rich repeat and Ig domain containing 2b n=1 Tax=Cynoglossus semilaevis TaxID=244447 RepID=A0A3P8UE37_CYNSE